MIEFKGIEEIENQFPDVHFWDIKETDTPRFSSLKEAIIEGIKEPSEALSIYAYQRLLPEIDSSINPLADLLNYLDSKYRKPDDPMIPTDYMQYALKSFLFNVLCEYETSVCELVGKVDFILQDNEKPKLKVVH